MTILYFTGVTIICFTDVTILYFTDVTILYFTGVTILYFTGLIILYLKQEAEKCKRWCGNSSLDYVVVTIFQKAEASNRLQ